MTEKELDFLFKRHSIRKYEERKVDYVQYVDKLLRAAMAAPSAYNAKPWHFITITNEDTLEFLGEVNPDSGWVLQEAPLCIAVCADPYLVAKAGGESKGFFIQDCSAATQNILLAATALGLGAVWLTVHPIEEKKRQVRKALNIPQEIEPFSLVAVGHPDEEKHPRDPFLDDRVHREEW